MAGLGNLNISDYDDDCQARAADYNKDWCKPLQVSMARLDQMQPTVCNMYLQPAGSLKPPKSMTKSAREKKQYGSFKQGNIGTKLNCGAEEENDSIQPSQDSVRGLSKTMAWGSNSSIPDLLARQKSQPGARPSSASRFPPRNRPSSAGKSRRPQSAKDTLNEKKEETAKDLGIKGSKKQMDDRPPILTRCNSDLGVSSREGNSYKTCVDESDVRNPTPYKFQEFAVDKSGKASKIQDEKEDADGSKTNQPDEIKSTQNTESIPEEVNNLSVRASQEEDKPVTPPMPESIRFSLPNMNDGSDEDDRDEDELNTERLLQQADSFMQKKCHEEQRVLDSLTEAHATIPDEKDSFDVSQASSDKSLAHYSLFDLECPISSVAAHNSSIVFPKDKGSLKDAFSHRPDGVTGNINHDYPPPSPHVTWSDSHTVHLFQTDSTSIFHDDKAQATRPRTTGSNKTESYRKGMMVGGKTGGPEGLKTETFKNHNRAQNRETENSFLMPDERHVSYKPLEVTKSGRDIKSLGAKTSLNSSKRGSSTKIIGNRLLRTSFEDAAAGETEKHSSLISCLSEKSVLNGQESLSTGQEPTHKLVPTVTLAYEDENDDEDDERLKNDNCHKKKKLKKKKTFDEIETYMSRLDKKESETTKENLPTNSNLFNPCACGDISCGELLTQSNQPDTLQKRPKSASKSTLYLTPEERIPVVKTTKTIEFCNGASPAETVIKNTLVAAHEGKPEKSESRQRSDMPSLLKPSMIKQQQASEDKSRLKSVGTKKSTPATENISNTGIVLSSSYKPSKGDSNLTVSQSDGGLAPPQTLHQPDNKKEEKSDQGLYETLLEEAKAMALTSMMEAAKTPTKMKTLVKPKPKISALVTQEVTSSSVPRPRPFSAPLKIASSKPTSKKPTPVPGIVTNNKHKYCLGHTSNTSRHTGLRRPQSAKPSREISRLDSVIDQVDVSPEMCQAERMQMKMAALGVQIDASVLEKALFPPSGKSIYYNVPGDLPRNPTESLIPHYKHWLAEDYHRVKLMERRLARDDEIKYMQKVAAEKKALLQKKGKKKKKKEKCVISAG
ncbi:CutA-like protein [Elysia marginata]|uniref:CutA-like protein n=1 Tax=Elysia marginata TaxID=1093978 RepID=A0AAV4G918_9GAST|nr:CutA-like protein [Elysia marginata]